MKIIVFWDVTTCNSVG